MCTARQMMSYGFWAAGALLALLALPAAAGIPRPSLILYGKVLDASEQVVTTGDLEWTFTPSGGGDPFALRTTLRSIEGPGGEIFSYRVLVPLEADLPGFPVGDAALPVASAAVEYVQRGEVLSAGIILTQTVIISAADVGSVKRVDVCASCPVNDAQLHSADLNHDLRFSLSEFLRVLELHTATVDHVYHANPGTLDGYSFGAGEQVGAPHSSDYYGGSDWRVTVHELVRMVDLFTATPDHSYSPDNISEDGFRKGGGGAAAKSLAADKAVGTAIPQSLRMQRIVRGGAAGDGKSLEITVTVDGGVGEAITGLGIADTLPEGWVYAGIAGGSAPAVAPSATVAGPLDFAWFPVPQGEFSFTYVIRFPIGDNVLDSLAALQGEGIWRTRSSENQALIELLPMQGRGGYTDLDNDTIPDDLDGMWDSDRDGVPDLVDVDSDNDGVTDTDEANHDGDPDYNPYDPVNNPDGTDTNHANPDTDGDGADDLDEGQQGTDPINTGSLPPSVPLSTPAGLLALLMGLGAAGGWILPRARRSRANAE